MDFYIDIGAAVMLRILREPTLPHKYRSLFLKVFKAIALAYETDKEFRAVMDAPRQESKE